MQTRVKVPIRIKSPVISERTGVRAVNTPPVSEAAPPVIDREAAVDELATSPPEPGPQHPTHDTRPTSESEGDVEMWRDRAQRLQAEMENFRKRQQRLADERVAADRERLLRAFLNVADDLERALNADGMDAESLRQGVRLTHQTMKRLLAQEGADPIQAEGEPFDPTWHEAVSTVPHQQAGVEPDTVVEVIQGGYRLGDRLLRPARVVVAT